MDDLIANPWIVGIGGACLWWKTISWMSEWAVRVKTEYGW